MNEYNSDFNRLSGANEATLNNETNGTRRGATNADNVELGLTSDANAMDEVYTAAPVRLVTDGSFNATQSGRERGRERERDRGSGQRVRGPLFYSHNSANAVTLAGDRNRQSNDPCAQQ